MLLVALQTKVRILCCCQWMLQRCQWMRSRFTVLFQLYSLIYCCKSMAALPWIFIHSLDAAGFSGFSGLFGCTARKSRKSKSDSLLMQPVFLMVYHSGMSLYHCGRLFYYCDRSFILFLVFASFSLGFSCAIALLASIQSTVFSCRWVFVLFLYFIASLEEIK